MQHPRDKWAPEIGFLSEEFEREAAVAIALAEGIKE
jgi:hypothetical protein